VTLDNGLADALKGVMYAWDVARFAREQLGFEADAAQSLVMNGRIKRGLLNCARQWGKSTITAIMAVLTRGKDERTPCLGIRSAVRLRV
jgi:hypothetical protein